MSQPVKLLVDECIGRPLMESMRNMLNWDSPAPTIHHLTSYFVPGEADDVWIPKIAGDGWMILTGDKGSRGRAKLPKICRQYKITHIITSSAVSKMKQMDKVAAIVAVWGAIKQDCPPAPAGSRFYLRLNNGKPVLKKVC
jgi:hypothetical protein